MKYDKIAAEHSIHLYRNQAGLLQRHYGRCQEDTVGWGHYSIYLYSFTVLFFPLTSEWHTFFHNVRLANCYSGHVAVWRQTADPGQDIVCLTPTTQGISLMWTDPYGQIDSLCLQRCWIFHWLLSARQRWVKSLLAVIVLQPQFWPNLRAIQARWQRSAEITNAWGNKVVQENWLLSVFHYSPSICQTSQIQDTGNMPERNLTHI